MIAGMGPFSEKDLEAGWEPCVNREVLPDICVCCGAYVPEGPMVCPSCEARYVHKN